MRLIPLAILLFLLFSNQSFAAPLRVLFDQAHGQAFTIEKEGDLQLGQLAGKLRDDGWQVVASGEPLTAERLNGVNALVISGAFKPLTAIEIKAIEGFLHRGGRLAVLLHIAPPLVPLLAKLGVASGKGVVREWDKSKILGGEPLYFKVSNLKEHPLNKGLAYFSLYGGWPLLPIREGVTTLASTTPMAWIDLDHDQALSSADAVMEFGLLVAGNFGKGEFAVFADDAIFQNRFLNGENEKLLENLIIWMAQGNQTGGAKSFALEASL
jgi:hypothetical protein